MVDVERLPGRIERETFNVSAARTRYATTTPEGVVTHNGTEVPTYMTPKEAAGTLA
jgi:hypothetical protein